MSDISRLQAILERLREENYPDLPADVVAEVGDIEDRYLFTGDPLARRADLRKLVENEVTRQEVAAVESPQAEEAPE